MEYKSSHIDDIYKYLCRNLIDAPEVNGTREINNVKITLTNVSENIVGCRNISEAYLLGELLWYFTGRNDVEFISKFSSFWSRISDDGITSNSAYGYTLMRKYGFDQIKTIIKLLKSDPGSRRAVLNINEPNPFVKETKDEPCTIAIQFLLRNGKLNCTAMMRSNDIWLGFPYDVAFFTELQKYIASELYVECGEYTHFATSLHVYNRDIDKISHLKDDGTHMRIDSEKFHLFRDFAAYKVMHSSDPKREVVNIFKNYGILEEY